MQSYFALCVAAQSYFALFAPKLIPLPIVLKLKGTTRFDIVWVAKGTQGNLSYIITRTSRIAIFCLGGDLW